MSSSTPHLHASMLATINTDLDQIAPKFEVQPDQIRILKTPAEFYETLKVGLFHVLFNIPSLLTFFSYIFHSLPFLL
jgi:hypothetical protein